MTVKQEQIRDKADKYFFSKVVVNAILIIIGALFISNFLRMIQNRTALLKQQENSEQVLIDTLETLESNAKDAKDLTYILHDGNQDMLDDLNELFKSGLFDSLISADTATRTEVFADMVERSGVDYLFVMSDEHRILVAPDPQFQDVDMVQSGLMSEENVTRLMVGTRDPEGSVSPVFEQNDFGIFYFYSIPYQFQDRIVYLVLGADVSELDLRIADLVDFSTVLGRSSLSNNGFLFAVDESSDSFLYFRTDDIDLTGQNTEECGLSAAVLEDGYAGTEKIDGVEYFCVSRKFDDDTVICAAAKTADIYYSDRYVLFWSVAGFVLIMLLCVTYAIIVRNDFIRRSVDTEKKIFNRKNKSPIIFDISIFKKVFPLMTLGVIVIFGISFYTQTLLEISETIEESKIAVSEVNERYVESTDTREIIETYYDTRFLAKARLIAYIIEEDPSALNAETELYYTTYDEDGNKHYLKDDEGNRLRSVSSSARLQELCDANDIKSIYIFDESGHTIATSTDNWYFAISHDPEDQSYPFLDVVDAKKDYYIQEAMVDDLGQYSQYAGTVMHYYTSVDDQGNTVYMPHRSYNAQSDLNDTNAYTTGHPVTQHRSMLQIGLDDTLAERLVSWTDVSKILSSDLLSGGFILLFDNTDEHECLYSPYESHIGKKAEALGISPNAFSGGDYYGFNRINGVQYFQYFHYTGGYYLGTSIPRANMYQARLTISMITALVSLLLILILSGTVTVTTEEEEMLYQSMSEGEGGKGFDSAIFNIVLPSGRPTTTVQVGARWDNRFISWRERTPEQKLMILSSIVAGILILYVVVAVVGVDRIFREGSVIHYILRGEWDRGTNIFAVSACTLVLIMTAIAVTLFRIPVQIIASLLGARGETVAHLLLSVVKYGGAIGAMFYSLYLLGMDATNLLASAGVMSLVIGLGAQSLIKDILAGIFIVFEGEFRVGDIVTIGGYRGTVADIGLRTTKIKGPEGNVKIYNNSEISGVLNMTKEASWAVSKIGVEYGQDIEYVEAVLRKELPLLEQRNNKLIGPPIYGGVSELGASGITLIIFARCHEKDLITVTRFLNREILQIFVRNSIRVPFPNVTVSQLDPSKRKTMRDFIEEEKEEDQY